jgi:hypothetical protein
MNTTLLTEAAAGTEALGEAEHHDEFAQIAERVIEIPQPDTPRLDIHRTGCQVSITWQGTDEKFRLEISDHAYVHGDWRPVGEPTQVAGGVHRVLLPGAAYVRYVRLARARTARIVRTHALKPAARRPARPAPGRETITAKPAAELGEQVELTAIWLVVAAAVVVLLRHVVTIY